MIRAPRPTTRLRRPIIAATTAIAAIGLFTGCAQVPASDQTSQCTPSTLVEKTVTGDGTGPVITDHGVATLSFSFTDGASGQAETDWSPNPKADGTPGPIYIETIAPFLQEALRCAQAGETVSMQLRADQMYDPATLAQAGVDPLATTDWSIRVDRVYHSAASGRVVPQLNGIPAVVNAPDGGIGVTMPKEPAPTELRVAETISGFGPKVVENDALVVQVSAYAWSTGEELYSSWNPQPSPTGTAYPFVVAATADDNLYGAAHQLVGHPIGSQVVVVVPAAQMQAGAAAMGGQAPGNGDAVVFVFDILGKY